MATHAFWLSSFTRRLTKSHRPSSIYTIASMPSIVVLRLI